MSPTIIVGYLALFVSLGAVFLFANLLVGKFLRPKAPNAEKLAVYECGEPTIGSSFVQFDLRFYVVALLFIIFDVELALFFPWATVFGKATHLMDRRFEPFEQQRGTSGLAAGQAGVSPRPLTPQVREIYRKLGVPNPTAANVGVKSNEDVRDSAGQLALMSMLDILVFFGVLMVGFAYVWRRGDLDWVRAVARERTERELEEGPAEEPEPALAG